MEYEIEFIPLAINLLKKVKDQREQKSIRQKIEKLKIEPEKQGKAVKDIELFIVLIKIELLLLL